MHGGMTEQELEQQVRAAEAELLDLEVAVETLRVELANFAREHHQRLGPLYEQLDELDVLAAELIAARTQNPEDLERARLARELLRQGMDDGKGGRHRRRGRHARPEPAGAGSGGAGPGAGPGDAPARTARRRVRPTKEAQRLYRELARRAHPDLTQDPAEKERREEFIQRVNDAYARGDIDLLRRLAEEWAIHPDSAPAPGTPERVGWLTSRLAWLSRRLGELRAEQDRLRASPIGQLLMLDPGDPDGLLDRLHEQLVAQVAERLAYLRQLRAELQAGSVESAGGRHRRA